MLINSFYIEGYRSIKEADAQSLKIINLFMGPNNVGKTNIFTLFKDISHFYANNYPNVSIQEEEKRFNKGTENISFNLLFDDVNKYYFNFTSRYGYTTPLTQKSVYIDFWKNHLCFIDINTSNLENDQLITLINDDDYFCKNISKWLSEVLDEELSLYTKFDSSVKISFKVEVTFKSSYHYGTIPYNINELGSGVTLVIALIMSIYLKQKVTPLVNFFIEEPERYLHSKTLIRLINLLTKDPFNNNRYFINTHSNALIDISSDFSRLYRVFFDSHRGTKIKNIDSTVDKYSLLDSLGIKPSQIFQTNYLLWVEGPSDRIYLNKWISQKSELIEGIHYTIMYYGGRLLSHLTLEEESDMINIGKIGINKGIIIDSDKDGTTKKINKTKQRIVEEFKKNKEFEWVTECTEIENYIEEDTIFKAIKKVHGNKIKLYNYGQYKKVTKYKKSKKVYDINKVSVAKEVCNNNLNLQVHNLNEKISELIQCIKAANKNI